LPRDADVHRLRGDRLFVDFDDHVMPPMEGPSYIEDMAGRAGKKAAHAKATRWSPLCGADQKTFTHIEFFAS
jgi:hypothetical protein